jgi:hypothetical protein
MDPITQLHDWLMETLRDDLRVSLMIRTFDDLLGDPHNPVSMNRMDGVFPILLLMPTTVDPDLGATSTGSILTAQFSIQIITRRLGVSGADDCILPLTHHVIRALRTTLSGREFEPVEDEYGAPYIDFAVVNVKIGQAKYTLGPVKPLGPLEETGPFGWNSEIDISVEYVINHTNWDDSL